MKKIIVLLLIVLSSCASRRVNIEKVDIKKDSIAETKVAVTTIEKQEKKDSTNIITSTDYNEIIITPIDSSKPITVDGKSYKNVVLTIKKSKTNTLYSNKKTESNNKRVDSAKTVKVMESENALVRKKHIVKEANYWIWIWLLILILIIYLLWRNRLRLLSII
jgi:hypothetical protein